MKINQWLNQGKYLKKLESTSPINESSKVTLHVLRSLQEWKSNAEELRPGNQSLHLSIPALLKNKLLKTIYFGDDPRMDSEVKLQLDEVGKFQALTIKSLGLDAVERAVLEVLSLYSNKKQRNELRILVAEPFSALSMQIRGRFARAITSGYMPNSPASLFPIRHIDLQRIDLPDETMDVLLTREIFEHLTDYRKALAEAARILKKRWNSFIYMPFSLQHTYYDPESHPFSPG
ncbi:MAG: methyltransferase domain-containing protein [Haliea sp.]|nr:methyltransferase domain-containing protein [Haliea sp.]